MSYDPTERAPQNPDQQPAQPPVTPPMYGQAPPAPPAEGQVAPTQYSAQPPAPSYGQPPQSNPGYPSYGQPQQAGQPSNPAYPPYGQQPQSGQPSNPGYPAYGQQPQSGQPSNPGYPPYGQQSQPGQPSNPGYPPYGQPPQPGQSNPGLPPYGGQPSNPAYPPYGQPQQAAYGQSSPTQPAYGAPADPYAHQSSNPGLPPYGAPGEQYGQPPQQPWGGAVPPGYIPPAAPPKRSGAKLGVILLVVVLILVIVGGGGGYAIYQNTRPKPIITLTSQYTDGATSVGATSTSLTLKGTDFTANSAITFLLDGKPVPGASNAQSDSNGKLSATTLTVTDAWSVGTHTLTAKDASGYTTKAGMKVEIVTPGQANTPGPNGAPTDSANMSVIAIVIAGSSSGTFNLVVTGSANGGTVCRDIDDGKTHTHTGTSSGVSFTEMTVSTCSGTYKGGKLDYTETVTTDKAVFDNGLICSATAPYVAAHLQGTFSSGTEAKGSYSDDVSTFSCNLGAGNQAIPANTGTWTGIAVVH